LDYNLSQKKAIMHKNGPALVLAGPGSGKTAVITARTEYLIKECKVNPASILVITFTKAAATEMKQRFLRKTGENHTTVTFGTFHAVFFSVLKHAYHLNAQNIIRDEQRYQYMKEIIYRIGMEYEDENEIVSSILSEISMVKNTGIKLENYYAKCCSENLFRDIYKLYSEKLLNQRLIDFDDMLVYTYELFIQRKDILSAWQNKFRYILIDEFQDINKIQYDIIKMLALPENNLFIVGDDDQSIYRFRGAKPEIMLNFNKDYENSMQVLLDVNYRSKPSIVVPSLRLINHNLQRFKKEITAFSKDMDKAIRVKSFENQKQENLCMIDQILTHVKNEGQYEDIAILFRTNTQPRLLMGQLMEYNIPFSIRDKIPNIYDHWVTKDIFTYIRMAKGSRERKDFLRIMNRPKRYISRESVEDSSISFETLGAYYEKQPWVAERIEKLEYDLKVIDRISPFAAINYIRNGIGYDEFCKEYASYRKISEEDIFDVLEELSERAKEFKTYDEWFCHIEKYEKELEELSRKKNEVTNSVSLATLHSSKGLEFPIVFIIDVNEGIMPYKKAVLEHEIEEERRMFYVGMTRAQKELYLYSVKNLNNHEMELSRFLKEIENQNKD